MRSEPTHLQGTIPAKRLVASQWLFRRPLLESTFAGKARSRGARASAGGIDNRRAALGSPAEATSERRVAAATKVLERGPCIKAGGRRATGRTVSAEAVRPHEPRPGRRTMSSTHFFSQLLAYRDANGKPLSDPAVTLGGHIATRYNGRPVKLGLEYVHELVGRQGGNNRQLAKQNEALWDAPTVEGLAEPVERGIKFDTAGRAGRELEVSGLMRRFRRNPETGATDGPGAIFHWTPQVKWDSGAPQWPLAPHAAAHLFATGSTVGPLIAKAVRLFYAADADGELVGSLRELGAVLCCDRTTVLRTLRRLQAAEVGLGGTREDRPTGKGRRLTVTVTMPHPTRLGSPSLAVGSEPTPEDLRFAAEQGISAEQAALIRELWNPRAITSPEPLVAQLCHALERAQHRKLSAVERIETVVRPLVTLQRRYPMEVCGSAGDVSNLFRHAIEDVLEREHILSDADPTRWVRYLDGTIRRNAPRHHVHIDAWDGASAVCRDDSPPEDLRAAA
jgi:hypothetical protein